MPRNAKGTFRAVGSCWRPPRWLALAFLCCLLPARAAAIEIVPFSTRNQSPVVAIYGLPDLKTAPLLGSGERQVEFLLDHASNYTFEQNAREQILLDSETTRLTLGGRYGLPGGFEVGVRLPFLIQGGGFLDGFLIDYHDWLGVSQGGRDQAPRNRFLYRYRLDGKERLRSDSASTGPGDLSLTAGLELYHDGRPHPRIVTLGGSLKLPMGDSDSLRGSGSTDAALWLAASEDIPLPLGHGALFGSAGLLGMSRGRVLPEQQRDHVFFGSLGIGWAPGERFALKVQCDFHTPFYQDSDLKSLSANATQLLLGGALKLTGKTSLDIALSEDIPTHTSPDMVLHLHLMTHF